MEPIREHGANIINVDKGQLRPITYKDLQKALQTVRASVSPEGLKAYEEWNQMYGSLPKSWSTS